MVLTVQVNGEAKELPDGSTVADLVSLLGLAPGQVAVEVNRELVTRARHAEARLGDGDRVEVVTLVGGG